MCPIDSLFNTVICQPRLATQNIKFNMWFVSINSSHGIVEVALIDFLGGLLRI